MKVSIITATYNSSDTITACIDSVLNQSYGDIEYIIMDGGSEDDTISIIESAKKLNSNIIFRSEPDNGIYDALNKGLALATGDIVGFVHSDDYLAKNAIIQKVVNAFNVHNADGVYGNLHYVSYLNVNQIVRNWRSQPFNVKLLNRGWMPAHPTLFLKKNIYDDNGNFNLQYDIAADYDFILRIFKNSEYKFYYLAETIVKMRVGGTSNRSIKNIIEKTKEDFRAAKTNGLQIPFKVILQKNLTKIPQWFLK